MGLENSNKSFLNIFTSFLKTEGFVFIFLATIVEFLFIDFFIYAFFSHSGSDSSRIMQAFVQIGITLPFAIFAYTYIYWKLGISHALIKKETTYFEFINKYFLEWLLVQIRYFSRSIMYAFLFLIPGIIESMRMSFSSLNVFYNRKMADIYYDPLMDSREKIQFTDKLVFLFFLFTFLIPFFINLPLSERNFFAQPLVRAGHCLSTAITLCFAQCFIFYKYLQIYNKDLETV